MSKKGNQRSGDHEELFTSLSGLLLYYEQRMLSSYGKSSQLSPCRSIYGNLGKFGYQHAEAPYTVCLSVTYQVLATVYLFLEPTPMPVVSILSLEGLFLLSLSSVTVVTDVIICHYCRRRPSLSGRVCRDGGLCLPVRVNWHWIGDWGPSYRTFPLARGMRGHVPPVSTNDEPS